MATLPLVTAGHLLRRWCRTACRSPATAHEACFIRAPRRPDNNHDANAWMVDACTQCGIVAAVLGKGGGVGTSSTITSAKGMTRDQDTARASQNRAQPRGACLSSSFLYCIVDFIRASYHSIWPGRITIRSCDAVISDLATSGDDGTLLDARTALDQCCD